jgi:DNA (cytosine-5)-methyltransferase 1
MPEQPRLTFVDLFAGAGGLSKGIVDAIVYRNRDQIAADTGLHPEAVHPENMRVQVWLETNIDLHAVNHWEPAIQTHETNHPWANHYHSRIEELYPPNIVEPGTVTLLSGGPECTHFSNARGGKPVSDQKRASAWHVLDWIEKLQPDHVLLENVKEFRTWGPINDDGEPAKDGSIFERWIGMLEALGYSVVYDDADEDYGVVLNAADYGDPQSRERLFIMASRSKLPTAPPPSHAENPSGDQKPRRPAADIIDWSDLGDSLWTRDLENPRVTPLKKNTMARIAEGIRRHCSPRLRPFADILKDIGPRELDAMRQTVIPAEYAGLVAQSVDHPFLVRAPIGPPTLGAPSVVKYYGTSSATPANAPLDTVTADDNHHAVSTPGTFLLGQHTSGTPRDVGERSMPTVTTTSRGISLTTPEAFCLRQQSGGRPVSIEEPLSTVSTGGAIGLATVEERTLLQPRNGQYGEDAIAFDPQERPMRTVIAGDSRQGHLLTPSLVRYSHGGRALSLDEPMPTVATEKGGTFALSQPYLCPMYNPRTGQRPRTRTVGRPLGTVPASKSPAGLAAPFLVDYHGQSEARDTDRPIGTIETRDRYALVIPEAWPWGLDVRYRMLQPDELKQAQGFPEDYDITGSSKKARTKQIGNAVPVNLARSLVQHLLADQTPSLSNFGGGIQGESDVEIPGYEEVASDD